MLDNGTPLAVTSGFMPLSPNGRGTTPAGRTRSTATRTPFTSKDGELGYTLAQPYGVIGVIITWNGPLISLAMKVPAALAAGNTVVVKPSEPPRSPAISSPNSPTRPASWRGPDGLAGDAAGRCGAG